MKTHFRTKLKKGFVMCLSFIMICMIFCGCNPDAAGLGVYDESTLVFKQFEPIEDGEEIAIVDTDLGSFKIRFFPDDAPNAVANFKQLVKEGFYNGTSIYNIQSVEDEGTENTYNVAFMTGASDENGAKGKTVINSGEPYPKELSYDLYPFPGAVAAYAEKKTCDSRFFVIGEAPISESVIKGMEVAQFPPIIQDKFKEIGGVPSLTHAYTIFAHIYDGYDVAQKIMQVELDDKGRPVDDICIKSITLENYSAEE